MIEMFIFLGILAIILEASVKTLDQLREFIRHAFQKAVVESDLQKLELMALSLITTITFKLSIIDATADPILGEHFSAGLLGYVLTGLTIGRGASVFHGIIESIQTWTKTVRSRA